MREHTLVDISSSNFEKIRLSHHEDTVTLVKCPIRSSNVEWQPTKAISAQGRHCTRNEVILFVQIFKGTYPDASVAEVYFFNHSMLPACHGTSSKKKNRELGIPSMENDRKRNSDVMTKNFDQ